MIVSLSKGGVDIELITQTRRQDVAAFLEELREIMGKKAFNRDTDFVLIRKTKPNDVRHSTPYTLVDLEYDVGDIIETLRKLRIEDYSESRIDRDDLNPPVLHVFGKTINEKLVYIKLKVRKAEKHKVICVSFHYAREQMSFPYA